VDELFRDFLGAAKGPCEKMDEVGLDTVVKAERRFLEGSRGREVEHLRWLETEFVERGRLGEKTGDVLIVRKGKDDKKAIVESASQKVWKDYAVDLSGS
jgi:3-hydroxyacyl-CoA dehydrogenase